MGEEMHVVTYWTGTLPETGAFLKVSKEKTNIFTICHRSFIDTRCYKRRAQRTNWNVPSKPLRL